MSSLLKDPDLMLHMPLDGSNLHGMRTPSIYDDGSTINNWIVNPATASYTVLQDAGTYMSTYYNYYGAPTYTPQIIWQNVYTGGNWTMTFDLMDVVSDTIYLVWDYRDDNNLMYLVMGGGGNPYIYRRRGGINTLIGSDTGSFYGEGTWDTIVLQKNADRLSLGINGFTVTWSSASEANYLTMTPDNLNSGIVGFANYNYASEFRLREMTFEPRDYSIAATGNLNITTRGNTSSVYFDGGNDYYTITDFYPDNAPITIAYWMYIASADQATNMMLLSPLTATGDFRLYTNWSSTYFYFDWGGSSSAVNGGRCYLPTLFTNDYRDKWTHVVAQSEGVSGGDMRIWFDGKTMQSHNSSLDSEGEYAAPHADTPVSLSASYKDLYIGQYATGAYDVKGNFADLRIWRRYLSAGEIKELYRRTYRD